MRARSRSGEPGEKLDGWGAVRTARNSSNTRPHTSQGREAWRDNRPLCPSKGPPAQPMIRMLRHLTMANRSFKSLLMRYGKTAIIMKQPRRCVRWTGDGRESLRGFPSDVKWVFGRALYKAQLGKRHRIAAPLKGPLGGGFELAKADGGNAYRLYYTLKCPGYVDVLFAHRKKSKRGIGLPDHEVRKIARRFKARIADCDTGTAEERG